MSFGEKLKKLRTAQNMTQSVLAKKLNLSKANISKYESNDIEPNMTTLNLIAELFYVSSDYLLGKTDNPTPTNQPSRKPTLAEIILGDDELSDESRKDLLKQMELLKMRDSMKKRNEEADNPDKLIPVFRAARSKDGKKPEIVEMPKSRIDRLKTLPRVTREEDF